MKRIVLFGGGRMGLRVVQALEAAEGVTLDAVVSLNRPDWLEDTAWYSDLEQIESLPDLLIDFTLPGGTGTAANWCRANLVPILSGTTGLETSDREALHNAAELIPVLWAPNLSRGVNILMLSATETAGALPADTPVEIIDVHHEYKKDAPSGTALLLAHAIAAARHQDIEDCLRIEASSSSLEHPPGSITCISLREGEVIGEHRVRFMCDGEQIVLSHSASNRGIYASGAVEAGLWLIGQGAGLYSAASWIGA